MHLINIYLHTKTDKMRGLYDKLLIFIALVLSIQGLNAQDVTTEGTDFWVSFMGNGFEGNSTNGNPYLINQLLISSKQDCTGTVTNPNNPNWSIDFTVAANNIEFIDIPKEQAYAELTEYSSPVNKGIFVHTTAPVSVYCVNAARYSFDASNVLPVEALGDDYIIQTYDQSESDFGEHSSAFLVIAIEDGETTVDITPSVKTLDGKAAGEEFSVTLHKGQVYQVRSHKDYSYWGSNESRDLSGSRVTARDCKKLAVFNGNTLTTVPQTGNDSDCIFEQAMPIQVWGRKFVATASLGRQAQENDYIKITSAHDDNVIYRNGTVFATLNANESQTFSLSQTDASCYIEATYSCAVYLYNHSNSGSATSKGAPSMVWIAPIEQRIEELTFSTFTDPNPGHVTVDKHYVNIIVDSEDVNDVTLDDNVIDASQFRPVNGSSDYMFYRTEIDHAAHHLSCPNGFNAHVYGFGNATGYAYMVGSKAADLSTTISVNDEITVPNDTIINCSLVTLTFNADVNLSGYSLVWDFGDGTSSTDNPVQHTYEEYAFYKATLQVNTQATPCGGGSTSNTYDLFIDARREPDLNYNDSICAGELYTGYGFTDILITSDTTLTREEPSAINPSCMRLVNVAITCNPIINGETISESGHCDFFEWNGNTYTEPGLYTDTIDNGDGCLSVVHLDLDLQYSPNPTDIYPVDAANTAPHWVVTSTEFQINDYDFTLWDNNPACYWDTVVWSLEGNVHWVLEPQGEKGERCKMYVLDRIEDTIWLTAKVYNGCETAGPIERRYWFVSSFYGIDEYDPSSTSATFDVTPNPSKGQMTLHFDNLTGAIDVKVFDMRGEIVDDIQLYNDMEKYAFPYQLNRCTAGVYLFVTTGREGSLTKKVIICP